MKVINIKFKYRKLRRTLIIYIVFMVMLEIFLIYVGFVIQYTFGKESHFAVYCLIFWSVNTLSMLLSQTILLMAAIKQRFGALNFLLESQSSMSLRQLKEVSRIHQKLTQTIELMNESYSIVIMFFLAGAFCLFNLFLFCIKNMIFSFSFDLFSVFMSRVLLNFYSFMLITLVIIIASHTTSEATKTIKILFTLIYYRNEDKEFKKFSQNFIQQIAYSTTKFSCGLFTYDWPLCFKVKNAIVS